MPSVMVQQSDDVVDLQCIPARYGVATYVPAGKQIKIINTSGTQIVGLWAFALPKPDEKKGDAVQEAGACEVSKEHVPKPPAKPRGRQQKPDLPSQEEAEKATREGLAQGNSVAQNAPKKGTAWSGYLPSVPSVPSIGFGKKTKPDTEAEKSKDSRTWSSYFAAGKGFSSCIPQQASDTVTQFAGHHARDSNKTYLQQLQDFSKTPVGAAGMSALTRSGYGSTIYAGYSAWSSKHAANAHPTEVLSLHHSRESTMHLVPKVKDTLVTNLRKPILTLVEDTSPGVHDTLIAACDPSRYQQLGAPDWEQHGSCSENLILALKELNDRAGLKGPKAVGAQVSVDTCPAPLNLWMNVHFERDGKLAFEKPVAQPGDYVLFVAERDVVVVMSSCPQDLTDTNNGAIHDAHFVMEDTKASSQAPKATQSKKKPILRKTSSSHPQAVVRATRDERLEEPEVLESSRKKPAVSSHDISAARPPQAVKTSQPIRTKSLRLSETLEPRKKPDSKSAAPVERKKPRKLHVRLQKAAGD